MRERGGSLNLAIPEPLIAVRKIDTNQNQLCSLPSGEAYDCTLARKWMIVYIKGFSFISISVDWFHIGEALLSGWEKDVIFTDAVLHGRMSQITPE